jgi:hypothetical protein
VDLPHSVSPPQPFLLQAQQVPGGTVITMGMATTVGITVGMATTTVGIAATTIGMATTVHTVTTIGMAGAAVAGKY